MIGQAGRATLTAIRTRKEFQICKPTSAMPQPSFKPPKSGPCTAIGFELRLYSNLMLEITFCSNKRTASLPGPI